MPRSVPAAPSTARSGGPPATGDTGSAAPSAGSASPAPNGSAARSAGNNTGGGQSSAVGAPAPSPAPRGSWRAAAPELGPNWFAAVMGTGIIAVAAATLPSPLPGGRAVPGLHTFATVVWLLDVALLGTILAATAWHWLAEHQAGRAHLHHPTMRHFYGAPPMAFLTVGAGALLLGQDLIGLQAALVVDGVLWTLGTLTGVVSAVVVPVVTFSRHDHGADGAFGGWLMPVVPPMVSAATGGLLVPYLPAGQAREGMLLACYAMVGLSGTASLVIITLIWSRLAHHGVGTATTVPTLWIMLGPLGQSVTALGILGRNAPGVLPEPMGSVAAALGVLLGTMIWGFAMLWFAVAATITIAAARRHLPFALTWWSFTFPVGTVVTGTGALALSTGLVPVRWLAAALYLFLLSTWGTVFAATARAVLRGQIPERPRATAGSAATGPTAADPAAGQAAVPAATPK